ncbi:MAG: proline--tRNA ligase [Desulfovibrio sp.]|nr:proline--tRNA ligase [Desulfovibrio sp.]
MRYSASYIPTLKETPADAEVVSQRLLQKAGMTRKLAAGVYVYLPLGLKTIAKIEKVIREEMNKAGFQELLMPMAQPAELWKETGRWDKYGKELLRFKDRNEREYCLGPTHEEVITSLARDETRSYRQLPLRLYQIQTKFRDERRPRFGLMRGREFLMKDAYSFDANMDSAKESYELMRDAYTRIFKRLGLNFRAVEADTGSIGGSFSHEFMVVADTGEDSIAVCEDCEYAANVERAAVVVKDSDKRETCPPMEKVSTPGAHTVEEVTKFLKVPPEKLIKTLIFKIDGKDDKIVAVLVRGDREANDIKLKKFLGAESAQLAEPETVIAVSGAPVGFAGPAGLKCPVYADNELRLSAGYVAGANEADAHLVNVDLLRDASIAGWGDFRDITEADPCPACGGRIRLKRGIEVGHIFMLGTKYSEPMNARFLDENGKEQTMIMGCYGIGVSRLAAAAIEQNNDEAGIIFPPEMAPVDCVLINLDPKNEEVTETADKIAGELEAMGLEVLVDDRKERPGVKFNDADLLGIPIQVMIGGKSLKKGVAEYKDRRSGKKGEIDLRNFRKGFDEVRREIYAGWKRESE